MGAFFNRRTIISVASVIYTMGLEPEKIPDMVKAAVIGAGMKGSNVPQAIRDSILQGQGIKLNQAFSYAKNHYYGGLPVGFPKTLKGSNDALIDDLAKEYIQSLYPSDTITIHDALTSYENDYQTKFEELVAAEYNYDFVEDKALSTTGSVKVSAKLVATGPTLDPVNQPGQIGYTLVFTNLDTTVVTINKWYNASLFDGYETIQRRVIILFSRNGGRAIRESYEYGGSNSRLNLLLRDITEKTTGVWPCVVLKKNNIYIDDDDFSNQPWETSPAWKTSMTYCRRMNIKMDEVLQVVKDNPDDKDIDFAFIQPGVRLASPTEASAHYMFDYFNYLRLINEDNKPAFDAWVADIPNHTSAKSRKFSESCPAQSIHIFDPDAQSNSIDMEISWRWISYEEKTGTIPARYTKECDATYSKVTASSGGGPGHSTLHFDYETTKIYLRRRLTDTTYAEIVVCGLRHDNYIYKGHSVQSGAWASFFDKESDDGTGFIMPLDNSIYTGMTPRARLQLAQEALHIVFNCYVARKQKWYETTGFKFVVAVIGIVIMAVTGPAGGGTYGALYESLTDILIQAGIDAAVAAAVAAIIVVLIMVAVTQGITYVSKELGDWAAEKWGAEWGAITQIAATIAMSYGIGKVAPSLNIAPVGLAQTVLMVGKQLLAGMAAYVQYTYAALKDDMDEWSQYVEGDNPLTKVNKLIEEMFPELTDLQVAALQRPEEMQDFLSRTLSLSDTLTAKLTLPINHLCDITLTPRL